MSGNVYQAFYLYDRESNTFPLRVFVIDQLVTFWDKQQEEIHSQIKHFAEQKSQQFEQFKTSQGKWVGSTGIKNPKALFLIMGQNYYQEDCQRLLGQIITYVEAKDNYLKLQPGKLQSNNEKLIKGMIQLEEDNHWQKYGQVLQSPQLNQQQAKSQVPVPQVQLSQRPEQSQPRAINVAPQLNDKGNKFVMDDETQKKINTKMQPMVDHLKKVQIVLLLAILVIGLVIFI